jgi:hypothetical protein
MMTFICSPYSRRMNYLSIFWNVVPVLCICIYIYLYIHIYRYIYVYIYISIYINKKITNSYIWITSPIHLYINELVIFLFSKSNRERERESLGGELKFIFVAPPSCELFWFYDLRFPTAINCYKQIQMWVERG